VAPTVLANNPPKTVAPTVLMLQTAKNCGSYSFDAREKTEMYCSHQYLSRKILTEM